MSRTFSWRWKQRGAYVLLSALAIVAAAAFSSAAEPEVRDYALSSSPLEIFDRLPTLRIGPSPQLSVDERKLLEKVWELHAKKTDSAAPKLDPDLVLEAMLLASGVDAPAERRRYREQFAQLVDKAQDAAEDASDDLQRGEALMKFLHAGVMNKGYDETQTSFTAIFDTGEANCVSATAIYYLVGSRLGLDLQPISIPSESVLAGHASLDMIDGDKRIQVEPTNPDGFDWGTKSTRPGVIVIGYVPSREDGHEVDALGVAAMIYSNRGTALSKGNPPQWMEAARCYLAALCLDPADETATNNLTSVFVNWGPALASERKYEDAVRVLAFGRKIAPQSDELDNNHRVVWSQYVEQLLEDGKDEEALPIIRRAAEATGEEEWQSASYWFIRHGETRLDDDWEAALAVVERGQKVLPDAEVQPLLEWRTSVFRRWSQDLLEKKEDVEASLDVLARAYELDATDEDVIAGVAFHTQEALPLLDRKGGLKAAIEHYQAVLERFPKMEEVADVGRSFAQDAIGQLVSDKKFKAAIAAVDDYQPLVATPEARAELGGIAYAGWAEDLANDKKWQAALDACAEGLNAYPGEERLTSHLRAIVDDWAKLEIEGKNWDEAIRIYNVGLEHLANDGHLQHNKEYCESMKEKK